MAAAANFPALATVIRTAVQQTMQQNQPQRQKIFVSTTERSKPHQPIDFTSRIGNDP